MNKITTLEVPIEILEKRMESMKELKNSAQPDQREIIDHNLEAMKFAIEILKMHFWKEEVK